MTSFYLGLCNKRIRDIHSHFSVVFFILNVNIVETCLKMGKFLNMYLVNQAILGNVFIEFDKNVNREVVDGNYKQSINSEK